MLHADSDVYDREMKPAIKRGLSIRRPWMFALVLSTALGVIQFAVSTLLLKDSVTWAFLVALADTLFGILLVRLLLWLAQWTKG
jgi:hypothetical protein